MASSFASDILPASGGRFYQRLARRLFDQLSSGRYAIGDRLPAEREHLLFTTEERAIAEARRSVATTRARYRAAPGRA